MPQIGTFTREPSRFTGRIETFTLSRDIIIVAADLSDAENAPDYRVHAADDGSAEPGPEIGAAWKRTGERAGEYVALIIDDPALPQPIRANLFRDDDAGNACVTGGTDAMPTVGLFARATSLSSIIPLFAEKPSHSSFPLDRRSAGARREGQGRSKIGAPRAFLTAASTLAGWRRSGEGSHVRVAVILLAGLLSSVAIPTMTLAQDTPIFRPSPRDPYADHIAEAAQRFELPSAWIRAVMTAESNGDPRAVSPKGAIGLMQIMPETWRDLRDRHRLGVDPYDPHDNISAGAAYIRELFDRYGSPGWIAAYNAGPGRYEASLKGRSLPPETRAYVTAVASHLDGAGDPDVP
eukprot:gene22729-23972_t